MHVVEYDAKYRQAFIDMNTAWIEKYFDHLEEEDIATFASLDEIVDQGAMIFFVIEGNDVLAACMTHVLIDDTWEICKLASNFNIEHKGAGSLVFKAAMDYAIAHGAKRLFLISNTILKPALHIYEKYGFYEIKLDDYEYDRGDIAYEYIVKDAAKQ